jgi:hypothetical protein
MTEQDGNVISGHEWFIMENTDTPPIFDTSAISIHKNKDITNATPGEIALICRLTFQGIEDLLTGDLKDIPEESVFDAEDALNKIKAEYKKLRRKGGVEIEILAEIKAIMPELEKALSQITAAADNRRRANSDQNMVAYNKSLPDYYDAVQMGLDYVGEINDKIARFDEIVIKKPDGIDSG